MLARMTQPIFAAFDVEADGPCPGKDLYSMVSLGLVCIHDPSLTFYSTVRPISERWDPRALAVSGFTREQTLTFPDPQEVAQQLVAWAEGISPGKRLVLVSDNPAFDWQWINHYTHAYVGRNPFGNSARRLGDLHAGWAGDPRNTKGWKSWRKTKHTHNALDDARGTAEGWRGLIQRMTQPNPKAPST